jgi:hypothetical protein
LQKALKAPAGNEKTIIDAELASPGRPAPKPLPFGTTLKRVSGVLAAEPKRTFKVTTQDLYALLVTLQGRNVEQEHVDRVRKAFPVLWED